MVAGMIVAISFLSVAVPVVAQKLGQPYFYMKDGGTKCFSEPVGEGALITVPYVHTDNPGVDCLLTIKDESGRVAASRKVTKDRNKGKLSFEVTKAGEHFICVHCEAAKATPTKKLKWHISIDFGDLDVNPDSAAKSHHMSDTLQLLTVSISRAKAVYSQIKWQEAQMDRLKDEASKTQRKIILFAAAQILALILASIYSTINLARYFHSQKLC